MEFPIPNSVSLRQIVLLFAIMLDAVRRLDLAWCSERQPRMPQKTGETFLDALPTHLPAAVPQQEIAQLIKCIGIIRLDLQGAPKGVNGLRYPPPKKLDQRQPGM